VKSSAILLLAVASLLTACDRGSSTSPNDDAPRTADHVTVLTWPAAGKRFIRRTIANQGGKVASVRCPQRSDPAIISVPPSGETASCSVSWTDANGYSCDVVWPLRLTPEGIQTAEEFIYGCTRSS
jgi:hypothetical protein